MRHPRRRSLLVPLLAAAWTLGVPLAHAQFPFLDPDDCSSFLNDPLCAPTTTCTAFGNDPALYDPATVAITPLCTGGQVLGPVADANGTPRYACLYEPPGASPASPRPLVVFVHPSLVNADSVWQATDLPLHVATGDLSGDPARPGFILLAPQGRNTCHYYPTADQHGSGWDNWYRNLDPGDPAINVDAATLDHFIAEQVASGKVDGARIFLTGWSNGAAMAYLYGLNRSAIAAVAVYSSPDPFRAFNDPCPQVPVSGAPASIAELRVSNPGVPTFHVHNDCDIAGLCPMGERLEASIRALPGSADHLLVNSLLLPAAACNALCGTDPDGDFNPCSSPLGYTLGVANHLRWPLPYTSGMLDFFRTHPRAGGGTLPLTVTSARLRAQSAGRGNGSVAAAGTFAVDPPGDVFDASAPITVRVDDGLTLDQAHTWAAAECVVRARGRIACASADRRIKGMFRPAPRQVNTYGFRIMLRRLAVDGPLAPPVSVTLTHGSGPTTRLGSIAACRQAGSGLRCRAPRP